MKLGQALAGGAVGAVTVTVLNETVRQFVDGAPRMEVIGMRALAKSLRGLDQDPPEGDTLFSLTLAGDLVSNALYYSLVGLGSARGVWARGTLLGLAAGLGAATLPRPMGLGEQPGERFPLTHTLTVAWYLAGGIAAAAVAGHLAANKG